MSFNVRYSEHAIKQLKKLDGAAARLIYAWIGKNLVGIESPYLKGKALVQDKKGQWRYRVGDFRIICEILDEELIILVLEIGHRKSIYR